MHMRIYTKKKNLNYLQYKPNIEKYEINITKDKRFRSSDGCNVIRVEVGDLCGDHCDSKWVCCDHCDPNRVCCDHCDSKWVCCDHCDSKWVCCDHCDPNWVCCNHCDFARPKKFYATLRDPKKICCDFARPK